MFDIDIATIKIYGYPLIKAAAIFVVGLLFINFISNSLERLLSRFQSEYVGMIIGKLVYYIGLFFVIMAALDNFGINTTQLLGAAGVVGVAVGFAAQTSVSNIISGAFLIAEKPFVIGDRLQVGNIIGRVSAIDLLSIKLVTADNDYIRIPNEYLVKNSFVNLTKYKLKRVSVTVGVSYKEDLQKVLKILNEIIADNEFNKNKEKILSSITSFDASSITVTAYMWVSNQQTISSKSSLLKDIKERFDKEKIEIPFPQVVVHKEVN
ncbi:hypothetical protein A3F66_05580 [candidate division TM6 bacterium RIFCSPHIGHO2_12_FULL_32_22]|nr:MAG: hypothetical protein A3F66_05580 [candidate division TM6 bacterium RIFCSPHIGHO2_12_FULL_32_22]